MPDSRAEPLTSERRTVARSPAEWEKPKLNTGTLFVLGAMNLIDCININLLTPYVDRMISQFLGKRTDDPQVVKTVGLLIGLYSLCEVIFSPYWGTLADRFGRRPVMLIGLGGSIIAPIIFGMSGSLAMSFFARGLDGFFCGNIGVTKTYLGEIVDSTNEARGFSFLAVCFSIGQIIGPMLGGQLVDPAVWAPKIFAGTLFDTHPYLLPNLTYAIFAAVSWVLGFVFLKETLPPWKRRGCCGRRPRTAGLLADDGSPIPGAPAGASVDVPVAGQTKTAWLFLFSYCMLSGYYMAWSQNFVLLVNLPRDVHGFELGPHEIGMAQNVAGVGLLFTQLLFYPRLTKKFGFLACFTGGVVVNAFVTALFPLYGLMADPDVYGTWRYVPLWGMMFFGQSAAGFCFPTMFVWINRSLEGRDKGKWNGWFNSLAALFRSFFPPMMDTLLSFGLRTGWYMGRYLPLYTNIVVVCCCLTLAVAGVKSQAQDAARKLALSAQGARPAV